MQILNFTELIQKNGLDPRRCTLLRHDRRGADAWSRGPQKFDSFVSYQNKIRGPYGDRPFAFQFIAAHPASNGDLTALFVAAHRVVDRFDYAPGGRLPILHHEDLPDEDGRLECFDLERLGTWDQLSERIVIRWGAGARTWSQLPVKQIKEVIELRQERHEALFPGFSAFRTSVTSLFALPRSWRGMLSSVGAVYLLVCPDSGEQYVGSAFGASGFWGRWSSYATTGHGGNLLLKAGGSKDYSISILEVSSPDMSVGDVIAREAAWKEKLGTRAHGLNLN